MEDNPGLIYCNGVDATTGNYLVDPMSFSELLMLAQGRVMKPECVYVSHPLATKGMLGAFGLEMEDLSSSGWGVMFEPGLPEEVRKALGPLLDLRRRQSGDLYKEIDILSGETLDDLLRRHASIPGHTDPEKLPYYLMLVGNPESTPFFFQYRLGIDHAVGRLDLENTDAYAAYAESVVRNEGVQRTKPGSLSFFAPANLGDPATRMSANHLAAPLADIFKAKKKDWQVKTLFKELATKSALLDTLQKDQRPDILFTASHGLGCSNGVPDQRERQGALVCQEWRPFYHGSVGTDMVLSAHDVASLSLDGMIGFHFACFGAGTPALDDFFIGSNETTPARLAPSAFTALLPQRMLARGALAVIGHVERAWATSFSTRGIHSYTGVFRDILLAIANGCPLGHAVKHFNQRWAAMSLPLVEYQKKLQRKETVNEQEFLNTWVTYHDARNYAVIGDPAVRLVP
ncbi:MAG: CHAT domain-containing protein [Magnetococcus sp. YQC-5]